MVSDIKKCKKLSFTRRNTLPMDYLIGSQKLKNVESFSDLRVVFDQRLYFSWLIKLTINKAGAAFGFIKRLSRQFDDPYVAKSLCMSLVRPIVEYVSVVCSLSCTIYDDLIEAFQKLLPLFALRTLKWDSLASLSPCKNRMLLLAFLLVEKHRFILGISFLVIKPTYDGIDSPGLLAKVNSNAPNCSAKTFAFIKFDKRKCSYEDFNPFRVLCKNVNSVSNWITISRHQISAPYNTRILSMSYLNETN